jgi:antitoxin VapB
MTEKSLLIIPETDWSFPGCQEIPRQNGQIASKFRQPGKSDDVGEGRTAPLTDYTSKAPPAVYIIVWCIYMWSIYMAMSIRNKKAENLARQLSRATGVTMTEAIIQALEDKLQRLEKAPAANADVAAILEISKRCAALPTLDTRTDDEILGYGPDGT